MGTPGRQQGVPCLIALRSPTCSGPGLPDASACLAHDPADLHLPIQSFGQVLMAEYGRMAGNEERTTRHSGVQRAYSVEVRSLVD